jgi:dienelactone hydrolase
MLHKRIQLTVSLAFLLWISPATSQVITAKVEIPVVGAKCNQRVKEVASVWGELRVPAKQAVPMALVVILHSNAGIISVGNFYAKALNAVGIATLEVDSFTPRGVQNGSDRNAPVLCDRLQEAWGALVFLSKDARFDAKRIGVVGFSSGAAIAIMTGMGVRPLGVSKNSDVLSPDLIYAAHFASYPGCSNIIDDQQRIRSWINPGRPQNWGATKKRIHIVSGTSDDYDFDPVSDCLRMGKEFPDIAEQLSIRMIEGATHGFDWPNPPPPAFSQFAKAQTGGIVTMRYSPKDAIETRQEMVEFFSTQLFQK